MKKIDFSFSQTVAILANLGVISGIIFLAYELRQNNQLLEAQAREAMLERRTDANALVASNSDLAAIMAKAQAGESLTPAENVQLSALNRRILASWEWQFGEYQRNVLAFDDLALGAWRATFHERANGRGLSDVWEQWKTQTTPDFIEFMESQVINDP